MVEFPCSRDRRLEIKPSVYQDAGNVRKPIDVTQYSAVS
jgi:hypothetical protein